MPREISVTDRYQRMAREQMAAAVGDPETWLRIDKQDGFITRVDSMNVLRAAQGSFKNPKHAIATGRFQTAFAIYCTGDRLTDDERRELL